MAQVEPHLRGTELEPHQEWYRQPAAKVALAVVRGGGVHRAPVVPPGGDPFVEHDLGGGRSSLLPAGNDASSLYRTYSGYLELVPRMIGLAANLVPIAQLSRFLTATSAVLTSLSAVALFLISRPLVPSRALRFVLATSTFAIPGRAGGEPERARRT